MSHPHQRQPFPTVLWTTTVGVEKPAAPTVSARPTDAEDSGHSTAATAAPPRNPLLLAELVSLAVASAFWLLALAVSQLVAPNAQASVAPVDVSAPVDAWSSLDASALANGLGR